MGDEKLVKVELNRDNINKCLCKICPVQIDSKCSKDKMDIVNEKLKKEGDIKDLIKPEEIPLVYCSNGKATCTDLSSRELCKCTQCVVWLENNLANSEPIEYFCIDGVPK
jgi:hypothetical protein